jgi:Cu/Ag efflux pump CusA
MNTRNQEMKNMSRTYRYTLEDYTLKNRQKRSGKNKLAWNTYREQSRDVSEMSQIEGFGGNHKKWNF